MTGREFQRIPEPQKSIVEKYLQQKPVPLGKLAKELGIDVKLSTLGRGVSGLIEKADNGYTIKINRHETRERQRYTLAHEISHFLLHRELIDSDGEIRDNVLYRSGQPEEVEFEANRLAADLIMPADQVEADLNSLGAPVSDAVIEQLAAEWQVSNAAMEIRLSPYQPA